MMEEVDKVKQRFELLKMARELLNEDYINKRAMDHNKWVAENDEMWRTRRLNVPYPPFVPYPTDEEIVRAARNLYNFIYSGQTEKETVPTPEVTATTKPFMEGDYVFPQTVKEEQTPEIKVEIVTVPEPVTEPETEIHVDQSTTSKLLPGWIRRTLS